jgi:hypothetical protein
MLRVQARRDIGCGDLLSIWSPRSANRAQAAGQLVLTATSAKALSRARGALQTCDCPIHPGYPLRWLGAYGKWSCGCPATHEFEEVPSPHGLALKAEDCTLPYSLRCRAAQQIAGRNVCSGQHWPYPIRTLYHLYTRSAPVSGHNEGMTGEPGNSCREQPMRAALTRMRFASGRSTFEFEGEHGVRGPPGNLEWSDKQRAWMALGSG